MSCPPHPPWFNHLNNILWRIQAVKFIIDPGGNWSELTSIYGNIFSLGIESLDRNVSCALPVRRCVDWQSCHRICASPECWDRLL
jgi:hypothetical protein